MKQIKVIDEIKRFPMQLDLTGMSRLLEKMAELELAIAEFYGTAGEIFQEDATFWTGLADAEVLHAGYIVTMMDILKRKPQEFEAGRPLNITATNLVISNIKNYIERLKKGDLDKKQVLFMSRDIENAVLESKYTELLKTTDIEYRTLVAEITRQTELHKNLLFKKIEELS